MAKKDVSAREKRIAEICAKINDGAFGGSNKDAVTWLGSDDAIGVERFSTGCLELDKALCGGWPKGRFIEIFGAEMTGKSTMVLHALAEYQKKYPDDDIALVDVEYTFDQEYAAAVGVNTKFLLVNQPETGDQALNVIRQLIQNGVKCIVVDSVAALTTKAENEGDIGDQQMADQARMVSRALRTLTQDAGKFGVTIFWTNQVRDKIGISYGDKTTTPAGRALKHYASVRIHMKSLGTVKEKIDGEDVAVCMKSRADVKKSKVSPPFRTAEFFITFGHGVDKVASLFEMALSAGAIEKRGNRIVFAGEIIGAGRQAALDFIREHDDIAEKIRQALATAKPVVRSPVVSDDEKPEANDEDAIPDTTQVEEV